MTPVSDKAWVCSYFLLCSCVDLRAGTQAYSSTTGFPQVASFNLTISGIAANILAPLVVSAVRSNFTNALSLSTSPTLPLLLPSDLLVMSVRGFTAAASRRRSLSLIPYTDISFFLLLRPSTGYNPVTTSGIINTPINRAILVNAVQSAIVINGGPVAYNAVVSFASTANSAALLPPITSSGPANIPAPPQAPNGAVASFNIGLVIGIGIAAIILLLGVAIIAVRSSSTGSFCGLKVCCVPMATCCGAFPLKKGGRFSRKTILSGKNSGGAVHGSLAPLSSTTAPKQRTLHPPPHQPVMMVRSPFHAAPSPPPPQLSPTAPTAVGAHVGMTIKRVVPVSRGPVAASSSSSTHVATSNPLHGALPPSHVTPPTSVRYSTSPFVSGGSLGPALSLRERHAGTTIIRPYTGALPPPPPPQLSPTAPTAVGAHVGMTVRRVVPVSRGPVAASSSSSSSTHVATSNPLHGVLPPSPSPSTASKAAPAIHHYALQAAKPKPRMLHLTTSVAGAHEAEQGVAFVQNTLHAAVVPKPSSPKSSFSPRPFGV